MYTTYKYRKIPKISPGAYIWGGNLTEGFLRYRFGYMEGFIIGILQYLWLRPSIASAEIIVLGLHMHQDWPVNMPIGSKEKFEVQFPQLVKNTGDLEQGCRCYITGVINWG